MICYSATGNVAALAEAAAEGAVKAGATAQLRLVAEAADSDIEWADVVLLGTPTRYGTMAAQLKLFIDATGPLWQSGRLAGKV